MIAVTDRPAAFILAIKPEEPERLFSQPDAVRDEYRALAKLWHPDRGGDSAVFEHIVALHVAAEKKVAVGEWLTPGLLEIRAGTKTYRVRYRKSHVTEVGEMFIGSTVVAFAVKTDYADLFHAAEKIIGGFKYPDAKLKAEVERYLPALVVPPVETGGRLHLIAKKTADQVLLRDLLDHCKGAIDPKHVAWMISSMLNIACYLDVSKVTHNAIGLDSIFVSPEKHSGALLGGWWYACPHGSRMAALPASSLRFAPADILKKKRATHRLDLELIRATGRELLGDPAGSRLPKLCPLPMANWLRYASAGHAIDDYRAWKEVLKASFGKPKFIEMAVSATEIYTGE